MDETARRGPAGIVRADMDAILRAALDAVDPEHLVRRALERGALPSVGVGTTPSSIPARLPSSDLPPDLILISVGKAAAGMARGAAAVLGGRVRSGVVLVPRDVGDPGGSGVSRREGDTALDPLAAPEASPDRPGGGTDRRTERSTERRTGWPGESRMDPGGGAPELSLFRGGHPLPDAGSVAGATAVLERVRKAGPDDRILLLLSGGGSALLTLPVDGVSLDDIRAATRLLMEAGADIRELNTVRKHLDRLKGGGLARAAAPAKLSVAAISDVVGDRLDVIASGPASPDPGTYGDAMEVLRARGLVGRAPAAVVRHLERGARGEVAETPSSGDACFERVETVVVGNAATAVDGAALKAGARGYEVRLGSVEVTGEARDVGRSLGRTARELEREDRETGGKICHLSSGETTVTVTGEGRGGRNQEVALGAALELARSGGDAEGWEEPAEGEERAAASLLVASVGTDGIDGPTDVAGAVAGPGTVTRALERGLSPEGALERNDSYSFFDALGDHVRTGPTGTNVMDLHVVLARGR